MDLLEQAVQQGNAARQILADPVFVEAKAKLKQRYLDDILKSGEADTSKRETLYLKIKVLDEIVTELGITEQNGVKAANDIKKRKTRATQ